MPSGKRISLREHRLLYWRFPQRRPNPIGRGLHESKGSASSGSGFAGPAGADSPRVRPHRGRSFGKPDPHGHPEGLRLAQSQAPGGRHAGRFSLQPTLPRPLGGGPGLLGQRGRRPDLALSQPAGPARADHGPDELRGRVRRQRRPARSLQRMGGPGAQGCPERASPAGGPGLGLPLGRRRAGPGR